MWDLWIEWFFAWRLVLLFIGGYFLGCLWHMWVMWRKAKEFKDKALTLKNYVKKLPWKSRRGIKARAKELIEEEHARRNEKDTD